MCTRPGLTIPPNLLHCSSQSVFTQCHIIKLYLHPETWASCVSHMTPLWFFRNSGNYVTWNSVEKGQGYSKYSSSCAWKSVYVHALLMVCVSVCIHLYDWILCVHDYPGTLFIFMVGCFSSSQCVWQRNQVLYPCWPQWELLTTLTAASAASVLHCVLSSKPWLLSYCCYRLSRRACICTV